MIKNKTILWCGALASTLLGACGSTSTSSADATAALRPGVEDSNEQYKGTPDPAESAFWIAVRTGDDAGRAAAVSQMMADVAADPSNGYSDFLIGAETFMPPRSTLEALVDGTSPPPTPGSPDREVYFTQALQHLTDPFYLGFGGGLLSGFQFARGDTAGGGQTFATAAQQNHIATNFISVLTDLNRGRNATQALDDMYKLSDYCNGGPIARDGSDAQALVAKQNAGRMVQRECYSGYQAPHGSSGLLLILADLESLAGHDDIARKYYQAVQGTSDFAT